MSVFHVPDGTPYHVENSIRGIHRAKRLGYDEIDLDMLMDELGNIYGCHWPRPMAHDGFRDPAIRGRMSKTKTIATMTPRQIARLIAWTRGRAYRIRRIERLIRECAKVGIGAVLEPKDDNRFAHDWPWIHIAKVADDCGAHVRVYGFDTKNIAAARRNGFRAKEIR